ncbi:N-acetylmuramidase domain-containing protein [Terricaulis sp.]|uniref:N-acetylmuramidase domain-containing protein n=1 Tax=Terricaulis sp. TaxID=2768686 RepID=UPI0037852D1D
MADVFLSYKREDRARAREIADGIEKHGFQVFFDAEIDVGEAFDERIEREIASAKCVVVLWSEKSASAKWVKREARVGAEREHLAPAIIGACAIPLEFSEIQAADLRAWRGDPAAPEWVQFINRITECTQKPAKKLAARPWRRRWIRIAAGLIVGVGLAGGAAYLMRDRIFPTDVASTTTTGTSVDGRTQSNTAVPTDVYDMLNSSVNAGECAGLAEDFVTVKAMYPGAASLESFMMRTCRRKQVELGLVTASTTTTSTATSTATATTTPSQGETTATTRPPQRPPQQQGRTPEQQVARLPGGYLSSLSRGDRTPLTDAQIATIAARIGAEPQALGAVIDVMSGRGGAFQADGQPTILFEPHIFSRRTNRIYDAEHPRISYARWNAAGYPRDQAGRWAQLEEAFALDQENALASASWGRFQIMGMNYAAAGFDSPSAFVTFMSQSEQNQAEAFVSFLRSNNLIDELQRKDWEGFTRGYNGPGQIERYSALLRQAYERRQAGGG